MTAQHTAGPWRYDPEWALIVGPNDEEIAACHAAQEYEEKRQEAQIRHKRNRAAFRASEHHHHEHPENMSIIRADDRTPEQKKTHRWGVVARDKFLSGWGQASHGASRCAWACAPDVDVDRVERWVRNRSEMRHVNVVDLSTYRPPRGTAHFHIYVCEQGHPATR